MRGIITFFNSVAQQVFLVASIFGVLIGVAIFLQNTFPVSVTQWIIICYVALSSLSIFFISLIFIYMNWYYEFYIVTNKTILHRYCFRLAGPFSDIVYGDRLHLREIVRVPPNLIYDFLKIEDVHVYFQKQEQEEPFIFESPCDAQEIEDLIHDLAIADKKHKALLYDIHD